MTSTDRRDSADTGVAAAGPTKERSLVRKLASAPGWLGDGILFLLTRLAGIETTFDEARNRSYPIAAKSAQYSIDAAQAEFLFKLEREDSSHTDDKVKQLLTLSSSLATVTLVFARNVRPRWMVVLLLGLLVCVVFLCLSALEVRTSAAPTLEDSSDADKNKQLWATDLLTASLANKARHNFRVDRYRAAGRYFRLALLLTPIAAACTVATPDQAAALQPAIGRVERTLGQVRDALNRLGGQGDGVRVTGPVTVTPAPGSPWDKAAANVARPGPDTAVKSGRAAPARTRK